MAQLKNVSDIYQDLCRDELFSKMPCYQANRALSNEIINSINEYKANNPNETFEELAQSFESASQTYLDNLTTLQIVNMLPLKLVQTTGDTDDIDSDTSN